MSYLAKLSSIFQKAREKNAKLIALFKLALLLIARQIKTKTNQQKWGTCFFFL